MKKIYLSAIAVTIASGVSLAQAPRFVLLEHFTQASCGPCASQNPGFEANVLIPNDVIVRHVAYHTSWPGVDEMNAHNPTEVATRVSYYNVTGVPDVVMLGNKKQTGPAGYSSADVQNQFSSGSPVKIEVAEVDNISTRNITATITTVGLVPSGNYRFYAMAVEDPKNYATPPGSNGETHFPNVFRKFITSDAGDPVTLAATGSNIILNYTLNVDTAVWNESNVKVYCFVQNESTKEVLNVGTVNDPVINYTISSPAIEILNVNSGSPATFQFNSSNSGSASEDFIYTLTTNAPANWNAAITINGNAYTSGAVYTAAAGSTGNIVLTVTPGASPAVASYSLSVTSSTNPSSPAMIKKVYVISGITDIILNNSGYVGDGTTTGDASNWGAVYTAGLTAANNTSFAATSDLIFAKASQAGALNNIKNVYFNVGWTFPGITDELADALSSFLDNNGNLFVSGQDFGWSIYDAASTFGTPVTQLFFTNYLHASYINDGVTANNLLTPVATDPVFGTTSGGTINNFYGGTYFFPDQIDTVNGGKAIYKYNSTTKIGGIRFEGANYKTVYIAPGMEMLNTPQANAIIKLAHDWFYGLTGTMEFDKNMLGMGQNIPNPADGQTLIYFEGIDSPASLSVCDIHGREVFHTSINKGQNSIVLETATYAQGVYTYTLTGKDGHQVTRRMMVK